MEAQGRRGPLAPRPRPCNGEGTPEQRPRRHPAPSSPQLLPVGLSSPLLGNVTYVTTYTPWLRSLSCCRGGGCVGHSFLCISRVNGPIAADSAARPRGGSAADLRPRGHLASVQIGPLGEGPRPWHRPPTQSQDSGRPSTRSTGSGLGRTGSVACGVREGRPGDGLPWDFRGCYVA